MRFPLKTEQMAKFLLILEAELLFVVLERRQASRRRGACCFPAFSWKVVEGCSAAVNASTSGAWPRGGAVNTSMHRKFVFTFSAAAIFPVFFY